MRKPAGLTLALLLLLVGVALAGESVQVYCTNPKCGYTADLAIGGGMLSPSITGYCAGCRDFVRLKLASWDQYRGQTYECPQGHGPFVPIYDKEQISRFPCPKCCQRTLKAKSTLVFD